MNYLDLKKKPLQLYEQYYILQLGYIIIIIILVQMSLPLGALVNPATDQNIY